MIGERLVAVFAAVVKATTLHLDGNNVGGPVIMPATGLGIEIDAVHFRKSGNHRIAQVFNQEFKSRNQIRNFVGNSADRY
jgi:hypothetical protein